MEHDVTAQANQIDPLLSVILTTVDPFDSKSITERRDRILEGDSMIPEVGRRLLVIPSNDSPVIVYGQPVV